VNLFGRAEIHLLSSRVTALKEILDVGEFPLKEAKSRLNYHLNRRVDAKFTKDFSDRKSTSDLSVYRPAKSNSNDLFGCVSQFCSNSESRHRQHSRRL
jgi:hypothetical protein